MTRPLPSRQDADVAPRIHILHTPCHEIRREDHGTHWCFGCRKRLPHTRHLWATTEPSYYEPHWSIRCAGCGKDRTTFPERSY